MLAETAFWLTIARLSLVVVPFRRLALWLGPEATEAPHHTEASRELLDRLAWALEVASNYTPWDTKCLARAIAGKAVLKSRRIASTLYLGVAKPDGSNLDAHAWLRCGDRILTGGRERQSFTVVARFTEAPGSSAREPQ